MKKRGVSPLLSTVLIIAFVVVLAAFIFGWGKGYIEDLTESAGEKTEEKIFCLQSVGFEISTLCYSSDKGTLKVGVDNRGKKDITGLIFRIKYLDGSADAVLSGTEKVKSGTFPIKEANLEVFEVEYDKTKNLKEIEIIPKGILKQGKEVTCIESSELEQIYNEC